MTSLALLVDDERDLLQTLDYAFHQEGFRIRLATTAAEARRRARESPLPDIIVLDLMLPDGSGLDVCRELKRDPLTQGIPIILLTARGEEIDRVVGFEVGADDYVVKPFSTRELILRARARARKGPASEPAAMTTFGLLRIDPEAHRVWVDDVERTLTALELRLLQTLLTRKGRVQSREGLLENVWGITADVTTRTVDTHVKRLREKLGPAGAYIETVRGAGYRFATSPGADG